jgi:hypothetical protein
VSELFIYYVILFTVSLHRKLPYNTSSSKLEPSQEVTPLLLLAMFSICSRFSDEELSQGGLGDERQQPSTGYLQSALAILSECRRQFLKCPLIPGVGSAKLSSFSPIDCSSVAFAWISRVWHGYEDPFFPHNLCLIAFQARWSRAGYS